DYKVTGVQTCALPILAGRTLRPERARLARDGLDPVAHHDFLTASTPPTRFASHPLEQMARWTPIGLQLGKPFELGLREQSGRLRSEERRVGKESRGSG